MSQVDGYLKRAQLEPVNGSTFLVDPAEAIPARVVADIDDTGDIKPYFHNGTDWKEIQLTPTTEGVVSQNSTKACTVDWSTGLVQRVLLTDNALISFINPQEGQIHRLIVAQNQTNTLGLNGNVYSYAFNMTDQDCGVFPYQPEAPINYGQSRNFSWLYRANARAGYATIPSITWPAAQIGAVARFGSSFSPNGTMFASGRGTSIFHDYLRVLGGNPSQKTPLAGVLNSPVAPLTAQSGVNGIRFHPSGNYVFNAIGSTPFVEAYATIDRGVPVGNRFADPAIIPTGTANCIDVYPNGQYFVVGHATTPFFSAYSFNGGQPVKLANPASLLTTLPSAVVFNPLGGFMATNNATSPFLKTYNFTDAAGTGTIGSQIADPSTIPTGGSGAAALRTLAWRPQGDYIAMAIGNTAPYLYIVPFSRSTGTYGVPITVTVGLITQQVYAINWTPDGQYLIVGTATGGASSLFVFDFSLGTIGTAVAFDGSAPTVQINDIAVHPSGEFMIVSHQASPWATVYLLPRKVRNYVRLS